MACCDIDLTAPRSAWWPVTRRRGRQPDTSQRHAGVFLPSARQPGTLPWPRLGRLYDAARLLQHALAVRERIGDLKASFLPGRTCSLAATITTTSSCGTFGNGIVVTQEPSANTPGKGGHHHRLRDHGGPRSLGRWLAYALPIRNS